MFIFTDVKNQSYQTTQVELSIDGESNDLNRPMISVERLHEPNIKTPSKCISVVMIILACGFIALYIVAIMMSIDLNNLETDNNNKITAECSRWHTAEYCSYSNWTTTHGYYVGQVETLRPELNGTITCHASSCIISSSKKCYYLGDKFIFYQQKKCDKHKSDYAALCAFTLLFASVVIFSNIYIIITPFVGEIYTARKIQYNVTINLMFSSTIVTAIFITYYKCNLSLG